MDVITGVPFRCEQCGKDDFDRVQLLYDEKGPGSTSRVEVHLWCKNCDFACGVEEWLLRNRWRP